MSIESAAVSILKRGVELDTSKRYTEALVCYQEGLQILVDKIKNENDETKRIYLRKKVGEYMNRAETIKQLIHEQKQNGKFHEQIQIENNSTGHSYKSLIGRFLDDDVNSVTVEDPYVRSFHQCQNFLRLCELLVRSCNNLNTVTLISTKDKKQGEMEADSWFSNLSNDLRRYKVNFVLQFSNTLHDRKISLNTGWIIKIGRGLDYFKPPENKFTLGMYDLDLRPCHETTVDIMHSTNVKLLYG